jgi:ATP-dependent Clp protease ATP-binding subunit ClpA
MFERFSSQARQVVAAARQEALDRNHARIGTEDLLVALLTVDDAGAAAILTEAGVSAERVRAVVAASSADGRAAFDAGDAQALASLGIDLEAVLARMKEQFGAEPEPASTRAWRSTSRLTPHAKKALQVALREAIWLKDRSIGSEHLLLGLLRAGDGRACAVLDELGVDRDALRAATLRAATRAA